MKLKVIAHEAVEGCLSVDIRDVVISGDDKVLEIADLDESDL